MWVPLMMVCGAAMLSLVLGADVVPLVVWR
jgi:hypothetical protein